MTAQIANNTANTRQNVSFRRIRRRSTMKSASSDIVCLPRKAGTELKSADDINQNEQWRR
jgi:hypothetical protein